MSKKKQIDWPRVRADLIALKEAGYRVRGKVITHWRISKPGTDRTVEVWPTVRKYMQTGDRHADIYTDVLAVMGRLFKNAPKNREEDVKKWRSGLDTLLAKINAPKI